MTEIFISDFYMIVRLFFINAFIWILFLPLLNLLIPNIKRSWSFLSAVLGWIFITFAVFFSSTFFKVPLTFAYIGAFTLVSEISLYIVITKWRRVKKHLTRENITNFIFKNLLFLALMLIMYAFTSKDAHVVAIERIMDYGYLKAIDISNNAPIQDIWYAGKPINYYYFGHFLAYTVLFFSKISTEPGFFISNLWLFASTCILIFETAYSLVTTLKIKNKKIFATAAGIISIFIFGFSGPWYDMYWLRDKIINYFDKNYPDPNFWYPEATRIIDGTITEFPIYSYLEATIHGHTFGYLIGAVVLNLLFEFWNSSSRQRYILAAIISFMIGIAYMTNTWDVLSLGSLCLAVFIFKFIQDDNGNMIFKNINEIKLLAIAAIACVIIAIVTISPWYLNFDVPVKGLIRVPDVSDFKDWFAVWGSFLIFTYLYILYRTFTRFAKANVTSETKKPMWQFMDIVITMAIVMWIFMETYYVKDILSDGDWYRANTVFKITSQTWLWLSIIIGPGFAYMLNINFKNYIFLKRIIPFVYMCFLIIIGFVYPTQVYKYFKDSRRETGYANTLEWYQQKYPYDYDAYMFLDRLNKQRYDNPPLLMEAPGESYQDHNLFSAYLGWPTIIGWMGHEWTWRGAYEGIISDRANDVWDFYTGYDVENAKRTLDKYKINYIILSSAEKQIYGENVQYDKIKSLGRIIFENSEVTIIEYTPHPQIKFQP